MKQEKRARILLGEMLDVCSSCKDVPRKKNAHGAFYDDRDYCKTQCTSWKDIQRVMEFIKSIQKERRSKKGIQTED